MAEEVGNPAIPGELSAASSFALSPPSSGINPVAIDSGQSAKTLFGVRPLTSSVEQVSTSVAVRESDDEQYAVDPVEEPPGPQFRRIFFYIDPRSEPVVTKIPNFVPFTAEDIVHRRQARKEATAAAAAKFERDVAAKAVENEANGMLPRSEQLVYIPEPEPPADSEQEKGVWEVKDVHSIRNFEIVCAVSGLLPDQALSRSVMYFVNLFPASGLLNYERMHTDLEFGILPCGPSLRSLEQLLVHLFLPILAREGVYAGSKFWHTEETHMMEQVGNELLSNMQRFLSQVSIAQQHLQEDTRLVIPSLPADCLDKMDIDYELLLQLESLLSDWIPVVIHAIEAETVQVPAGKSPLAEIEFWRDRANALSSLYEQLNSPKAKRMLALLELGSSNSNLLASFKSQFTELSKLFLEAKDNVKFLTTLERHFKTLCTGAMPRVLETISPMMNALRMVWIISSHYSDDTRMGALFERIAYQAVKFPRAQSFHPSLTPFVHHPSLKSSAILPSDSREGFGRDRFQNNF